MCSPQVTGSPLAEIFWKAGPEHTKAVFSVLLQKRVDTGELQIADVPMAASQFFTLIKGEAHARMVFGCCAQMHTPEAHLTACVDMFLRAYGELGRASLRESTCQYVYLTVVPGS